MGNALVVGVVEKIGLILSKKLKNYNPKRELVKEGQKLEGNTLKFCVITFLMNKKIKVHLGIY